MFGPSYTLGRLHIDGELQCWTLEDRVREEHSPKVHGETAIPYGDYQVILTRSPKFRATLPLLVDVPGFEGIRIHAGNSDQDTSGCILVGEWLGVSGDTLLRSRAALTALMVKLRAAEDRGEEIRIMVGE